MEKGMEEAMIGQKGSKTGQKVLIVEDDEKVLEFLNRLLIAKGYSTETADCGSQAIRRAATDTPDIVILDLSLPDSSGIEVLQQLKEADEAIQVIMLTGYGSQKAVRDAMELGAFDFLTKPFDVEDLCGVIQRAISTGSSTIVRNHHHAG